MVAQKDGKKRKKNAAEVIPPVLPQYINKLYGVSQPGSSANFVPALVPPINNNASNIGNNVPINSNVSKIENVAPTNNNASNIGNNAPINSNVIKIENVAPINNNASKIGNGAPINNSVNNTGNNAPINNNVSKIGNSAPINSNWSNTGNYASPFTSILGGAINNKWSVLRFSCQLFLILTLYLHYFSNLFSLYFSKVQKKNASNFIVDTYKKISSF